jgi:hypothetical protein
MITGLEPHRLLELVHEDFTPFAQEHKAELVIAEDPWGFLEVLASGPQGGLIALHWGGDTNTQADMPEAVFAENQIEIGIAVNPGLAKDSKARALSRRPGDRLPLIRLVAEARRRARSLMLPDDGTSERRLRYAGCDPVVLPDGVPLSAYRMRFQVVSTPSEAPPRNS